MILNFCFNFDLPNAYCRCIYGEITGMEPYFVKIRFFLGFYGRGVNSSLTVYNDYFPNILLVKLGVSFSVDWCFPTILTINPPDSTTSVCLASNNTCCAPTCGTNLYVYDGTIVSACPIGLYAEMRQIYVLQHVPMDIGEIEQLINAIFVIVPVLLAQDPQTLNAFLVQQDIMYYHNLVIYVTQLVSLVMDLTIPIV